MPTLRREFYSTLRQMLSIADERLLTDKLPPTDPHNVSARILRLGLAISAFASLEKYLAGRVETMVQALSVSAITASSLTDELRAFLSIDAVIGLANRLNFEDPSTKQAFADATLAQLARYSETPASYTGLGFSPRGANVAESDITKALKAFGIKKVWERLAKIASDVGSTSISLQNNFTNLAKTRHRSAHEPASNIPSGDLKSHIETSILVAVCFDCLAISIVRSMASAPDYASFKRALDTDVISYRFVDRESAGTWVERATDSQKVRKRSSLEANAVQAAAARPGNAILILRDAQSVPIAVV